MMGQLVNLLLGGKRSKSESDALKPPPLPKDLRGKASASVKSAAKRFSERPARADDTGSFVRSVTQDMEDFSAELMKDVYAKHREEISKLKSQARDLVAESAHLRAIIETTPGSSARERLLLEENHRLREERRKVR